MVELEVGYLFRKAPDGMQHQTPFLLKLTLADWLQAQVGGNGGVFGITNGEGYRYFDDMMAGFKFRLFRQQAPTPTVSFSAMVAIPTSQQKGYLRTYKALFTLYLSRDFGWLHADFNLGLNALRLEGDARFQGWVALSLNAPIAGDFGAGLEGYLFTRAGDLAPTDAGILFGPTWSPLPWLVFDIGADVGLVRSTRSVSAFLGMTMIPARLWTPSRGGGRR